MTNADADHPLAGAGEVRHQDVLGAAYALAEGRAANPEAVDLLLDPPRQLLRGCLPLLRGALGRTSRYSLLVHGGPPVGRASGC